MGLVTVLRMGPKVAEWALERAAGLAWGLEAARAVLKASLWVPRLEVLWAEAWYRKSEGGAGRENAVRGAQERCAINIELPMTRTEFDTRATIPLGVKKGELVRLERAQVWQIVLVQIFD
eukprot:CAMPEP_0171827320 /NCGR_PEP_ID=MMETSP0992-20121227/6575_1 /TAXON_ID=483369 /ORGANISM="non described non described, Strain CCMP2098" /LENGTH=119 /DNA_ID=CAMNT_0012442445 /DNA_START=909 /DNA_END=1266 /DNA_ORIENTATION=-